MDLGRGLVEDPQQPGLNVTREYTHWVRDVKRLIKRGLAVKVDRVEIYQIHQFSQNDPVPLPIRR